MTSWVVQLSYTLRAESPVWAMVQQLLCAAVIVLMRVEAVDEDETAHSEV